MSAPSSTTPERKNSLSPGKLERPPRRPPPGRDRRCPGGQTPPSRGARQRSPVPITSARATGNPPAPKRAPPRPGGGAAPLRAGADRPGGGRRGRRRLFTSGFGGVVGGERPRPEEPCQPPPEPPAGGEEGTRRRRWRDRRCPAGTRRPIPVPVPAGGSPSIAAAVSHVRPRPGGRPPLPPQRRAERAGRGRLPGGRGVGRPRNGATGGNSACGGDLGTCQNDTGRDNVPDEAGEGGRGGAVSP